MSTSCERNVFVLAVGLLLTGSAAGAVHYVAPDGTGDGSSWAQAADFATAYAAAGAAGGGELWLKKGFHALKDTVIIKSGVVVRGGFAGTESSASEAKPKVNVTSISGDTDLDNMWLPENTSTKKNFVSLYDGLGGYAPINPDRTHLYWSPGNGRNDLMPFIANDLTIGFTNATGAVVTGAEFRGLHFSGFRRSAFELTTGEISGLVFDQCRFLAINTTVSSGAPLVLSTASAVMTDCDFKGNYRCIYQSGGTLTLKNCRFEENHTAKAATGERNAIIAVAGSATKMFHEGCVFNRNFLSNVQSYPASLCIHVASGKVCLSNTTFTCNKAFSSSSGGNCRGILMINSQYANLSAVGCSFTDNLTLQNSQAGATVFQSSSGSFLFENCYIARNVVTNYSASIAASAFFLNTGASAQHGAGNFVNCTIEKNRTVAAKTGGIVATIYNECNYGRQTGFVNCTIADNEVTALTDVVPARMAEYVNVATSVNGNTDCFFNSVVKGKGASGHPFLVMHATANHPLAIVRSVIYDYPAQTLDNVDTRYSQTEFTNALGQVTIPMVDAKLGDRLVPTGGADVKQRGVLPGSPCRAMGWPYWKGTDGNWWYRDTAKGDASGCRTVNLSQTLAVGWMPTYVPGWDKLPAYHDAVGKDRNRNKVCLGPLNPAPGLTLLVR